MSIWYQYDITAVGDRKAIGKFFNLDPEKDIHYIDSFEFSFGQKNIPGLRLGKLIEQNPDLLFIVKHSTDYDITWSIERFDQATLQHQHVTVEYIRHDMDALGKINSLLLEEYSKVFPYLMDKHQSGERPYEWKWFFNDYTRTAAILSQASKYEKMDMLIPADVEFDNQPLAEE
jgi:hypothetical protein